MTLHSLMLVLTCVEPGADQHDRLSGLGARLIHEHLRLVQKRQILWVYTLVEIVFRGVWLKMDVFTGDVSSSSLEDLD